MVGGADLVDLALDIGLDLDLFVVLGGLEGLFEGFVE